MAKTFEALKKAEEERKTKSEVTPFIFQPVKEVNFSSQTLEEYHRMKHKILWPVSAPTRKTLLFCSPRAKEGNSTVLIHFAITLASEGDQVLLVDANLRHPVLHEKFRLKREQGLSEVIQGKQDVPGVMKRTSFENLWVITSGANHSNPSSILESEKIVEAIAAMKKQADWVLFDCSPVNVCIDPIALAGRVDGVVIVVEAEKTRWEVAQDVKEKLQGVNHNVLGIVLNKRRFHIPRWLYRRL